MPKQPVVTFRIDDESFALAEKLAASRGGLSIGAYARQLLLEDMSRETEKPLEIEVLRQEVRALRSQISKGTELLARLMFRTDPNQKSELEDGPAAWVQREIPR